MISSLRFLFSVVIMIFLVAFAVKNNTPVRLYYYFNFQSPEIPLFVIVLVSVFIGALCVWLMALFDKLRMKMIISKKEKTIREMEKELVDLRNLPPAEPVQEEPQTLESEADRSEEEKS